MKKFSPVLIAVLGVIIGVLATLTTGVVARYFAPRPASKTLVYVGDGSDWRKLDVILEHARENYVDSIDFKQVTEAAIMAALAELDPHSVYMPPVELEEAESELAGNFDGIGIQFNVPNDTAIVLEVIPGGPSEKIGLMKGDRIVKIDGLDVAGVRFPQDSIVRHLKGPAGTKVNVVVSRDGALVPFSITRGKIPVVSVAASFMLDDRTGYIRLSRFTRTTLDDFLSAAMGLKKNGMTKLVFDLRDNTGGYMDQALNLANLFLKKGQMISYLEGLHREREVFRANGRGSLQNVELVVLINENSASSSEIFAGAIQDNDRGVIIGRRSFGKGVVQEPAYFTDGSGLRLTVARYHTPSGRCIQKPFSDDYAYDYYKRYTAGELVSADSIKVDSTLACKTLNGRTVYGGGGIIPDVFVPMDTTRATPFYIECNRRGTAMRFASEFFDAHKADLSSIDDFSSLRKYLSSPAVETQFLAFASSHDGLTPSSPQEWIDTKDFLMVQVRALVGRYSKLGENAFYHIYMEIDETVLEALENHQIF